MWIGKKKKYTQTAKMKKQNHLRSLISVALVRCNKKKVEKRKKMRETPKRFNYVIRHSPVVMQFSDLFMLNISLFLQTSKTFVICASLNENEYSGKSLCAGSSYTHKHLIIMGIFLFWSDFPPFFRVVEICFVNSIRSPKTVYFTLSTYIYMIQFIIIIYFFIYFVNFPGCDVWCVLKNKIYSSTFRDHFWEMVNSIEWLNISWDYFYYSFERFSRLLWPFMRESINKSCQYCGRSEPIQFIRMWIIICALVVCWMWFCAICDFACTF